MAENENKVVEETTDQEVTKVEETNFKSKNDDSVIKVDLSKPPTPETDETTKTEADTTGVVGRDENADTTQEQEEVQPQGEVQEDELPVLEEVTEEEGVQEEVEAVEEKVEEAIAQAEATGKPLPENIQKLIDFMDETGGDIQDYVELNRDLSKLDDADILDEYFRSTKPHLDASERNFLLEEKFSYDEETDDEKTIRSKKIALKEQVAEAKAYLDGQKSKYYEDIKAGSKLSAEQQKAIDFFNRYNKESEESKKLTDTSKKVFTQKTNNLFSDKFKGFEYNVGDKSYRFNVKNVKDVKETQSDLNNFIQKFLDKDNLLNDAKGYHKSLFTAMNADAVAKHFYDQGRADAIKNTVASGKNINLDPRGTHNEVQAGGMKVKVLGDDSNSLKFKFKKRK